jgi:gliding motility-associated-like protein
MIATKNTTILLLLTCILLLISAQQSQAQKSNYNWLFGYGVAINFDNGNGEAALLHDKDLKSRPASISDPVTGELLMYTDGDTIWNKHAEIIGTSGIKRQYTGYWWGQERIFLWPVQGHTQKFFMFISGKDTLLYLTVDLSLNNGLGAVSSPPKIISTNMTGPSELVKNCYVDKNGWLITRPNNTNQFWVYRIDSVVHIEPIISSAGLSSDNYGFIAANNRGNKIVLSHGMKNNYVFESFDFDAVCGTVSNANYIPVEYDWGHIGSIAFSASDTLLYIVSRHHKERLIQLSGSNLQNHVVLREHSRRIWDLKLGPDKRIYFVDGNYEDENYTPYKIGIIHNPDRVGTQCLPEAFSLKLFDHQMYRYKDIHQRLPDFAEGKTITNPINDGMVTQKGHCANQPAQFKFNTTYPFDSIKWELAPGEYSNQTTVQHTYTRGGKYQISLTIYRCGISYIFFDSITILEAPEFNFPTDTFKCVTNNIILNGPACENYLWSNRQTQQLITIKDTGTIWLRAGNGNCFSYDTIVVKNYNDAITDIGSEYFLCEDEKEMVKLDAGEGFTAYKWTPTNDTTQWIMVKQVGNYFVKVTDNNGCTGNDDTKVNRKCGVTLYIPNVFTPNNDGNNDVFLPIGSDVVTYELKIYNRWGQLVFTSNDVSFGWDGTIDGKAAAGDVYVYQITYQGYQNKVLKTFTQMGNVTLVY